MPNLDDIFNKIKLVSKAKHYKFKLILTLVVLSLFFATPPYHYFKVLVDCTEGYKKCENWRAVMKKVNSPLDNLREFDPDSHAAKKVFRVTVPILMKLTFSDPYRIYIIQFVLGIITLLIIFNYSLKIFDKDIVSASLLITGLSFVYFGRSFYVDLYSWFDGWAFFFLLLTIVLNKWYLVFIAAVLASWTDERALVALSIAFIAHQTMLNKENTYLLKDIIKLNKKSIAILIAMTLYLMIRFYLENNGINTQKSNVGFDTLSKQIEFMGFGLWTFFEGFWLVVLLFFILSFYNRHYAMSLIYFVPIAILSIVSFTVFDITRSGSYMFYIVFPMLIYIYKYIDANSFRLLLFFSAIVSFVFPAYYIIADTKPYFLWYKPLFIRGADYLLKYYSC